MNKNKTKQKTFAVNVSNLVRKKKKNRKKLWNNEQRDKNKLEHFFIFFRAINIFWTCILAFIADICFLCSTHFWPTFPFYALRKYSRTTCSPASPEGINWEHQPNEAIIDWPKYDQYPHPMPSGNKTKALRHFQGDTKPEDQQEKGQVTR